MSRVRVAACQVNTVVGDLEGNADRILRFLARAEAAGADVAVFPELATTGYPPEDLLLKPGFVVDNLSALDRVAAGSGSCAAILGFVDRDSDLRNAAAVCFNGAVRGRYHKRLLPNYAVFDEQRYFAPGAAPLTLFEIAGIKMGLSICEDAWSPAGPMAALGAGGAELILNLNASPYYAGRLEERQATLAARSAEAGCPVVYVNQVGGQDELVFDGASMVVDVDGTVLARANQLAEDLLILDLELGDQPARPVRLPVIAVSASVDHNDSVEPRIESPLDPTAEVYAALVVGTRDYLEKNGVTSVWIGVSGGIDSSLVAAIAVDAVGPDRVHAVSMPSRYSSDHSLSDAKELSGNLGIDYRVIPIEPAHSAFLGMLADSFASLDTDLTEENLQSRVRGVTLMALSNKHAGSIVLTTGNKSELAVGYSTLYGDTAGGFAVIKDVPKTLVYELCRWRNQQGEVIPQGVLTKPPSAELRPDQTDQDSLPPYEVLDPILEAYVEDDMTVAEMVKAGFDAELVRRIARLVDGAEYKRRQNPPGVRVSPKAFGKDRRLPITNRSQG